MSMITLMRLYLRYQSMPRLPLPCIGYAGTLYSAPIIDRQKVMFKDEVTSTTDAPETAGAHKALVKPGSFGSFFFRRYSTSTEDIKKAEKERQEKNKFKLKTLETVKVMVVSETGSISAMTLVEANKLAKKKGLKLVHITNPSEKPIQTEKEFYKLVSRLAAITDEEEAVEEVFKKEAGRDKKQMEVKTVLLKSNTGEHDVNAKIKMMKKWIQKGHRIRVQISQAGDKSTESVFQHIATEMKEVEGQVQQKIAKDHEIRFYVGPPKKVKAAPPKTKADKENSEKMDKDGQSDKDSDDEVDEKKRRANR